MFLAIHDVFERMLISDLGSFDVPYATGPHCLKRAFIKFMGVSLEKSNSPRGPSYTNLVAGIYHGASNGQRSVSVVGDRKNSGKWIKRYALRGKDKREGFKAMNITNYGEVEKSVMNRTCIGLMLEKYNNRMESDV